MSPEPSFVVSDIHLGSVPATTEVAFRAFLRHVTSHGRELLINGDLFDYWFEYRSVIQGEHFRVLAALADAREAGVRLRFVGGNHDAWGGAFLREQVGMEFVEEGAEIDIGGSRALVVHGDGVGSGDVGYRALKRVLRSRVSIALFRLLHPDLASRIASRVSTTEQKHGTPDRAHAGRAEALRRWAGEVLVKRSDLDLVLAGHTHTPEIHEVREGGYYVNTGDWINHFTYLVLTPGSPPELRRWPAV